METQHPICYEGDHDSVKNTPKPQPKIRKIYALPTSLTLGNIFFGFYSIITVLNNFHSTDNRYLVKAAGVLILSAFLDMIDGKVARLTKTTSEFGLQLDSLADVISFGLAPGILAYAWALHTQRRFGWLPVFLFLICGAIRLARFNVQSPGHNPCYFTGLPIPAAAMVIVTFVLLEPNLPYKSTLSYFAILLVYVLSFLMVSTIQYRSFKEIDLAAMKPVRTILVIVVAIVIIMHDPKLILFILAFGYASSGVIARIVPKGFHTLKKFRGGLENLGEQIGEIEESQSESTDKGEDRTNQASE